MGIPDKQNALFLDMCWSLSFGNYTEPGCEFGDLKHYPFKDGFKNILMTFPCLGFLRSQGLNLLETGQNSSTSDTNNPIQHPRINPPLTKTPCTSTPPPDQTISP